MSSRPVALIFILTTVPAFAGPPAKLSEPELARKVDALLAERWKDTKVVPASRTDDATFIRRAFLDLAGRIPSILEIRDFLDDDRPDKRRIWVDDLLRGLRRDNRSDTYSDHFAAVWGSLMVPVGSEEQGAGNSIAFQGWMRNQLREKVGYNEIVRRILVNEGGGEVQSFYQANENKPENLAAAASRLFLGVKLECAQCHDDRSGGQWTREQFWELAVFFSQGTALDIPGAKRRVEARFLDGTAPDLTKLRNPRETLAKWMTSAENPYFASTAANRVWAYLFGIGIIDPVDERGDQHPPSHPELLDELATQFVLHDFDLKYLLRALIMTEAYQRVSLSTHPTQEDPRLFARMQVRGLSAAQLFDSLAEATEYRTERNPPNPYVDPSRRQSPRDDFVNRFTSRDRPTEATTSILQALHLMNGPFMARSTSLEHNRTLATVAEASKIDTARRLETLFLVALSRKPTEAELARLKPYIDRGGPTGSRKKALADVFWALLNTAEFRVNH